MEENKKDTAFLRKCVQGGDNTDLHMAILQLKTLCRILEMRIIDKESVNKTNGIGVTAFHCAVVMNRRDMVEKLLEFDDLDVNKQIGGR